MRAVSSWPMRCSGCRRSEGFPARHRLAGEGKFVHGLPRATVAATNCFTTKARRARRRKREGIVSHLSFPLQSRQDHFELSSQSSLRLRAFACDESESVAKRPPKYYDAASFFLFVFFVPSWWAYSFSSPVNPPPYKYMRTNNLRSATPEENFQSPTIFSSPTFAFALTG